MRIIGSQTVCFFIFGILRCAVLVYADVRPELPIPVLVSVPPQIAIAQSIAGDWIEVSCILQPGEGHETFSPKPSQVQKWLSSRMFWRCGLEFENVLLSRFPTASSHFYVVDAPETDHAHHEDDSEQGGHASDPHFWLDPILAVEMARRFADGLIEVRPELKEAILDRFEGFAESTRELDRKIEMILRPYRGRVFLVYHGAFESFAERYDIKQVFLQRHGQEPSSRHMVDLLQQARGAGVKVVYRQPQESSRLMERFASSLGAEIEVLDPMRPDWSTNMLDIARTLAEGFSRAELSE